MKKFISILLAGIMIFSLTACNGESEENYSNKKNKVDAAEENGNFDGENESFDEEEEVSVQIGDCITFGKYEQDNDTSNGKEDIEWLVLEKEGDRVLVISKYGLDCVAYNNERVDVTWETSTLRSWLNNEFINDAFTSSEKACIPTVTVTADDSGNDTQDKVYILDWDEAFSYFGYVEARWCKATDYAIAQGAWVDDDAEYEGNCWWWLRSSGTSQDLVRRIFGDGTGAHSGIRVNASSGCVRPVMWIEF